jgi:hypothetical protein
VRGAVVSFPRRVCGAVVRSLCAARVAGAAAVVRFGRLARWRVSLARSVGRAAFIFFFALKFSRDFWLEKSA